MTPQDYFRRSEETQIDFAVRANELDMPARQLLQQQISKVLLGGSIGSGAALRMVVASKRRPINGVKQNIITLRDLAKNELEAADWI